MVRARGATTRAPLGEAPIIENEGQAIAETEANELLRNYPAEVGIW
jgi:hypothetical protein